jgi:hypothetical protein
MDDCCKVGEIGAKYSLERGVVGDGVDQTLVARWLGDGDYAETGLRPLTDWFNRKVLKTVYNEHGRNALETRVRSDYEVLTDGDRDERLALVDDLATDGIDGEQLRDDFISAPTLYRHFTNCLDVEKTESDEENGGASNWEEERVAYVKQSVRRNTQDALQSLENKDRLPHASDAQIEAQVILGCPVCGTTVRFERALERGYVCEEHMSADGTTGEGATRIDGEEEERTSSEA